VLISGGYPSARYGIFGQIGNGNFENDSCPSPKNLPNSYSQGIVSLKDNLGRPMVCGSSETATCLIFEGKRWIEGPAMSQIRYAASVAKLSNGKYLITGGLNTDTRYFNSLKLFNYQVIQ